MILVLHSFVVTSLLLFLCVYLLGFPLVWKLKTFWSSAGLTTSSKDTLDRAAGMKFEAVVNYPKIRDVIRHVDGLEFVLFPAYGKTVDDYIEKADALAQFLHAAEVVISPMGIGDRAKVVVHSESSIPPKYSITAFLRGL